MLTTGKMVSKVHVPRIDKIGFDRNRSMVSPVWYNIRRTGVAKYQLGGEHDVDVNWMNEVRGNDSRGEIVGRILPRFSVEEWDTNAYKELAENVDAAKALVEIIVEQVR